MHVSPVLTMGKFVHTNSLCLPCDEYSHLILHSNKSHILSDNNYETGNEESRLLRQVKTMLSSLSPVGLEFS